MIKIASRIGFEQFWHSISKWRGRLGHIFNLLALLFMGWAIWQSFQALDLQNLEVKYSFVLFSETIIFIVVLMGASSWCLLAMAFGFQGHWTWHFRNHLFANVSKYLPGSFWVYLSKGTLSVQSGTSKRQAVAALFMELVIAIASAAILALLTGWSHVDKLGIHIHLPKILWIVLSGITIFVVYLIYHYLKKWVAVETRQKVKIGFLALSLSVFVFIIGWLLLAISLIWIVLSVYDNQAGHFTLYIFALSLSMMLGILILFFPNGIGIREGVLVFLLGDVVPLPIAFLSALALRIGITIAELAAFLLVVFYSSFLETYLSKRLSNWIQT